MHKFENCLVVGISSRALFDLEEENRIFDEAGVDAYTKYQIEHENDILKPGTGFALIKALLKLNEIGSDERKTEIIVMSRNNADSSLRIFNSIRHYQLDITRAALVSGAMLAPYLEAFNTDLFLSANEEDVQEAINAGVAAGIIYTQHLTYNEIKEIDQIRIAFDGDAVLFSDESERIYKSQGIEAFQANETKNARKPLPEGPFARFLKTLSAIQKAFDKNRAPIRTALVTARNAPAHERVIRTLRAWDVRIDEAFFLGGMSKQEVLKAFGAHIYFDDQAIHTDATAEFVPSARVPYKNNEE
ncbi:MULTISPECIES: 5'-nucleotidase [Acetobacterium]|uniref:5'-nucleotidase n=1 Tax=Acetobacterium TaxID=33951 RepID=UPI000B9C88CE|nr:MULTISPECIES: 5'-nucleotidase [Acetobacterium]MEA4807067.1 5'-nucleotidase [Acetobacterium wieringae]OXS27096.1 MAG: 5'-nucleotidase [Acetobacterium sp. MES1]